MARVAFAVFAVFAVVTVAVCGASAGASEDALLGWLNKARTQPATIVAELQNMLPRFQGTLYVHNGVRLQTKEGAKAVNECISAMKAHKPVPALTLSQGMSRAAAEHVADIGPKGKFSHTGTGGSTPFTRMNKYGKWGKSAGENMGAGYGPGKELEMVLQLLVDDGVSNRGHRTNILSANFLRVGLAVGPHKTYGHMNVQDFAAEYTEKAKF